MEIKTGLWKKKSQKGNTYCSGKIKIENKEYYLTLFNNDKKGNDKAPDFNLIVRDAVKEQKEQEKIELGQDKVDMDQVFADFGNQIEYSEDDCPF